MRLLTLIFVVFLCSGCVIENNQERIAMTTLYPDDAPRNPNAPPFRAAPILTGALNSRFPTGSDLEGLKSYVAKLKGSCYQKESGQPMECSFIESGTICWVVKIEITAKTNSQNKIEHIEAVRYASGC